VARGRNALRSPLARVSSKLWSRSGKLFPQRDHEEVISMPAQAGNALRCVPQNGKQHGLVPHLSIDLGSSAPRSIAGSNDRRSRRRRSPRSLRHRCGCSPPAGVATAGSRSTSSRDHT
jgi:hypothetical protein